MPTSQIIWSQITKKIAKLVAPPPKLSVSQWADNYRKLSSESSAEPGSWHTSKTPYQREIMDAVNDPKIEMIVVMSSAQVGKTEVINNIVGYHIHQDPAPMLIVQPTEKLAESWSTDRLTPMLRDSEIFKNLVKDPKSRDSGNKILYKRFPGGHITMAGSNSPSSLASRPVRIVLCDEVDRYPASSGSEGDPVNLAKKRATTFWNRKIILTSTPTIKYFSRIELAYLQSDQRRYYVPCKLCGEYQTLKWSQIRWPKDKPEEAHYVCEVNGCILHDNDKMSMLQRGKWISEAKGESNNIAGFHLSEIYSPWVTWARMTAEFLKAKMMPETLKTWVNTSLGETWEEGGDKVDETSLLSRKENWGNVVPNGVVIITAGVDVQNDRLEVEIVGWGVKEESWSLDYRVIYGDPARSEIWDDLDNILEQNIKHQSGINLRIASVCVDSGGHHTQAVYAYCKKRQLRRIFAIKGSSIAGKALVSRPSIANRMRVKLFSIGTDTAKEMIYSRLKITELGPGYCHFPINYDAEYFKQLTAEKIVTYYNKGFPTRKWEKPAGKRNEALDCRVYALAALYILNPNLELLANKMLEQTAKVEVKETKKKLSLNFIKPIRKTTSFVKNW
ncbi:phage terminase large subunit family protein [Candidatus Tisiphia endosymbiont of Temnostethus pusillus]|uniref:phage terminase large subunit family protein n=1 Tax=Candidatus Tisiphia endosymbiont of Temnostethus pusillus TaxID=3139335 RepID=UPI0035C8B0EF